MGKLLKLRLVHSRVDWQDSDFIDYHLEELERILGGYDCDYANQCYDKVLEATFWWETFYHNMD